MFTFLTWLVSRDSSPTAWRRHGLLDESEFAEVLLKEKVRSDRTGIAFSILKISGAPKKSHADQLCIAAKVLKDRLRITDSYGLWKSGRIGIVLPYTPTLGAQKVAADVVELLKEQGIHVSYDVMMYPEDKSGKIFRLDKEFEDPTDEGNEQHSHREKTVMSIATDSSRFYLATKRALDVMGAVVGIVFLWPVFVIAALVVKSTSKGPILFAQVREGKGGRQFVMYKFRTMIVGADQVQNEYRHLNEQDGPAFKITDDPRITRFGKLLRDTCIDELPQLWNVLNGDMSLVGPRPLPTGESQQCANWQRQRLGVTPGLTCFWQLDGKTKVTFDQWMRMDLQYVRRRSIWMDVNLIAQTVLQIFHLRGSKN